MDYDLPEHLIAQYPKVERDSSRLLVVERATGSITHQFFRDLPGILSNGDLLVLNDSRVLPARLIGRREKTSGKWQGLFLRQIAENGLWEMLSQSRGYAQVGERFAIEPGPFHLILRGRTDDRHWLVEPDQPGTPGELLERFGRIPLPPYIRKGRPDANDSERYQTVYGSHSGSVAAPTAGLHFTPELLDRLAERGIATARVTLHVGLGTFAPIKDADPTKHRMHFEWRAVPEETVAAIRLTKANGKRVVAVGTTAARSLESAAESGDLIATQGETNLFIYPPYEFRAVDALITNFHLPRTTLLLLVAALAGDALLQRAYAEAIASEYRFYSYGDAMIVL